MTDLRTDYLAACASLKALAASIVSAGDAAFEAPPGMVVSRGETGSNVADVKNPTLDTVLDPRRLALSQEVKEMSDFLRLTSHVLDTRRVRLDSALARWAGETGSQT